MVINEITAKNVSGVCLISWIINWLFHVLQETEFLTSSIGQLKVVQTKYVEAKDSLSVLNKSNAGELLKLPWFVMAFFL